MKNLITFIIILLLIASGFLQSCEKKVIPTLTTIEVSDIKANSATSGGIISDEGSSSITARGVCWSTEATPTIDGDKTSDGAGAGTFTSPLSGLTEATQYYVRAYATNSEGTGYGMAMSFSTLGQAPTATTQSATNVTTTSATLNGTVNANYVSTVVSFEYGTTTAYGQTITATQSPVTGNSNRNVNATLTGLEVGTGYHFRVKTVNSLGTIYGNDMLFITLGLAPTATTQSACCLSSTGATLNGTINANYISTIVTFEFGTTAAYGASILATQSPISGNSPTSVSAGISGLNVGTTYHFRVKAVSPLGTTFGEDMTFKTLGGIPIASTMTAINLQPYSATLYGSVNANYSSADVSFEYGLTTNYGSNITAVPNQITGGSDASVSANISSLSPNTTYHYRVRAINSFGTTYGLDNIFTTDPIVVSDIEGNSYNLIRIGNQLWMKENLKTTRFNDNTVIAEVHWADNNEALYKNVYGGLYHWDIVNSGKLCPSGWHVPTRSEWATLSNYLGGDNVAGGKLKEAGITHWNNPNTGATNESGFTALGSGYIHSDGNYVWLGIGCVFWSSTQVDDIRAWERSLGYNVSQFNEGNPYKASAFSIRCLKD